MASVPELGVGITYSKAIEPLVHEHAALFDVVEIEPQMLWTLSGDREWPFRMRESVLERLKNLPAQKLVHSIGVPVGGALPLDHDQLAMLRSLARDLGSPWLSEHLSFNATTSHSTGFFLPPRQTTSGVAAAVAAVDALRSGVGAPVAVETGVNYLRPRHDEMPDGAFVGEVSEAADCGILLDLHNIYTNARNGRESVDEFLAHLPLERVWEIHLAGGFEQDGFWLDAHSGAICSDVLEIARRVIPILPNLGAINFEIFPSFVEEFGYDGIRSEMEVLHQLWGQRIRKAHTLLRRAHAGQSSSEISPSTWREALGAAVIGRPASSELATELARDPGVALVGELIHEFRGSMVVGVFPLTSRLIMLARGPAVLRSLLERYWQIQPPIPFAASEAIAFAEYLEGEQLDIPDLNDVLAFERAVVSTMSDDRTRVVGFAFDPIPLLSSLAERSLPSVHGEPGNFELEIRPNDVILHKR
jgi:uncharacterized protein (UPF0276 family)